MTKKKTKSAPASLEEPGSGYIKPAAIPYPKRHRVAITFPAEGMTRSSFQDECDINNIVNKFTETGILTHNAKGKPGYGEAPDQTLFEAACTQAEIRSAGEDGTLAEYVAEQEAASEAPQDENEPVTGSPTPEGENALHAENEAAELTSRAE